MAGIGGWLGDSGAEARSLLAEMGRSLGGAGEWLELVRADGGARLVAAGREPDACCLAEGGFAIAIEGHPRWSGPGGEPGGVAGVARACLRAYRDRGIDCLAALQGDFAVAIADAVRREVTLAVDRFGIRDLVYQTLRDEAVFGSTCDAVNLHSKSPRRVDPQAVHDYAFFHVIPGPATIFAGVHRVAPGGYAVLAPRTVRTGAYWTMSFRERDGGGLERLKSDFRDALRRGVAAAVDGASCGAFLSGGTDSSTVSGLVGEVSGRPARTFSIGFAATGYDETEYARIASRHFGTEHREYRVTPDDVVSAVPLIAAACDQPFGNASAVPTYYCAKLAADGRVGRLLAGDGGDELFAGNARYARQHLLSLYERLPAAVRAHLVEPLLLGLPPGSGPALVRKARSYVAQASVPMPARYEAYNLLERLGAETVFAPDFLAAVDRRRPLASIGATWDAARAGSLVNRMLAVDFKFTLADNDLRKVTRMCALAGVDVAFPMLHEDVVDVSSRVPPRLKLKGTRLRWFFKEALRDFLPAEILAKSKHGFGLPVGAWLVGHPPLRALAGDALSSLRRRGLIRPEFVDRLLGEHLTAHPAYYGTMAWVLMMLELWLDGRGASV